MLAFKYEIAEDRKAVALTIPNMILMVENLEGLIQRLIEIRAQLLPEVPTEPHLLGKLEVIVDPKLVAGEDVLGENRLLGLRHPGLGWLWWQLPLEAAARLGRRLAQTGNQDQGPKTLS